MPATTQHGFRIPLDSDPAADGAKAVRELGTDVDDKIGVLASGAVNITLTASASGSANVAFPANRFPVGSSPTVLCTLQGIAGGSTKIIARVNNKSNTGCTINLSTGDGTATTTTVSVGWLAHLQ